MTGASRLGAWGPGQSSSTTRNARTKSSSDASRQRDHMYRPKCREHDPPVLLDEVVLWIRYPRGRVPSRGFRCPICGDESLLLGDGNKADELAHELGLFGLEQVGTRRLLRAGNSIAVTLDPQLVEEVLSGAKPGTKVRVGRLGKRIFVEPA